MSISSRPIREKKQVPWHMDHIQLQMLTLERNDSRKSKVSNHQNQHYGKILSSFIMTINQEYIESLHKKDKESELSGEHQNEDEKKCANNYGDWPKKKTRGKTQHDPHRTERQDDLKKKYQFKKLTEGAEASQAQKREEKRKVKSTETNENLWYKLYLINKMQGERKSKAINRSTYHVYTAYRIHFDQTKNLSLDQVDPTFHALKLKGQTTFKRKT